MDYYEAEVRELERRVWAAHPWSGRLVLYGSSSIRLWPFERSVGEVLSVNMGFGGSTLEAAAHYFERVVAPLRPASCVFYAGDNDLGDGHPPERVLGSYHKLMAKFDARLPGCRFAWISIKPSVARWALRERIGQTNAWMKADVDRRDNGSWVDVYWPMLRETGDGGFEPRPELYLGDGLHLNRKGYALWTEALRRDAGPVLDAAPRAADVTTA